MLSRAIAIFYVAFNAAYVCSASNDVIPSQCRVGSTSFQVNMTSYADQSEAFLTGGNACLVGNACDTCDGASFESIGNKVLFTDDPGCCYEDGGKCLVNIQVDTNTSYIGECNKGMTVVIYTPAPSVRTTSTPSALPTNSPSENTILDETLAPTSNAFEVVAPILLVGFLNLM